jgi:hypothetical protein
MARNNARKRKSRRLKVSEAFKKLKKMNARLRTSPGKSNAHEDDWDRSRQEWERDKRRKSNSKPKKLGKKKRRSNSGKAWKDWERQDEKEYEEARKRAVARTKPRPTARPEPPTLATMAAMEETESKASPDEAINFGKFKDRAGLGRALDEHFEGRKEEEISVRVEEERGARVDTRDEAVKRIANWTETRKTIRRLIELGKDNKATFVGVRIVDDDGKLETEWTPKTEERMEKIRSSGEDFEKLVRRGGGSEERRPTLEEAERVLDTLASKKLEKDIEKGLREDICEVLERFEHEYDVARIAPWKAREAACDELMDIFKLRMPKAEEKEEKSKEPTFWAILDEARSMAFLKKPVTSEPISQYDFWDSLSPLAQRRWKAKARRKLGKYRPRKPLGRGLDALLGAPSKERLELAKTMAMEDFEGSDYGWDDLTSFQQNHYLKKASLSLGARNFK